MAKGFNVEQFVDKKIDQISAAGEKLGGSLGGFGRIFRKGIVAVVVLVIFGLAAFLWSLFHGMAGKKD